MQKLASLIFAAILLLSDMSAAVAAPLGYTLPKYLEQSNAPTPEGAKVYPRVSTQQTSNVSHSCSKNLHTQSCVKRCIKRLQKVQRTRSVRGTVQKNNAASH